METLTFLHKRLTGSLLPPFLGRLHFLRVMRLAASAFGEKRGREFEYFPSLNKPSKGKKERSRFHARLDDLICDEEEKAFCEKFSSWQKMPSRKI